MIFQSRNREIAFERLVQSSIAAPVFIGTTRQRLFLRFFMSKKWYQSGLHFACKQCGRCCTGEPGYVWVCEEDIQKIASELGIARDRFEETFVKTVRGIGKTLVEFEDGDCALFDGETRKCRIYDSRPIQCRTWPFWSRNVDSQNSWKKTAKFCPGCNQGTLFAEEQIEMERKKIDI